MTRRAALRTFGALLFGFATFLSLIPSVSAAILGFVAMLLSFLPRTQQRTGAAVTPILVGIAVVMVGFGFVRGATDYPDAASLTSSLWVVAILVAGLLVAMDRRLSVASIAVSAVAITLLTTAVVFSYADSDTPTLDVFRTHVAASEAMQNGDNPYTPAVRVKNGSPNAAPGEYIEGYGYPPVTLVGYVAADLFLGDPRWASALSFIALAWLGMSRGRSGRPVALALLALAAIPMLRAMVWSGWTEPLSLALLAASAATWVSVPVSAVLLGLALGTKQYLVVLGPLLLIALRREPRRLAIAGGVTMLSMVYPFVADFDAAWFTLIERPLSLGFRPDTRSLSGLFEAWNVAFRPGSIWTIAVALALGLGLGVRVKGVGDVLGAAATVLAGVFLFSMAFTNYWFFVAGLAVLSVLLEDVDVRNPDVTRNVGASSA